MRRLAHLSDLHFGRINPAAVDGLLRSLEDARPNFVSRLGDFHAGSAYGGVHRAARAFLDRLPAPTFAVPGNHDLPPWNPIERLLRPYARYRRFIAEELEPFWSDAKVGIVGMKSPRRLPHNLNRAVGGISERQLERVLARLDALPKDLVRVVVVHHPLLLPEGPASSLALSRVHARGGPGRWRPLHGIRCGSCCPAIFHLSYARRHEPIERGAADGGLPAPAAAEIKLFAAVAPVAGS